MTTTAWPLRNPEDCTCSLSHVEGCPIHSIPEYLSGAIRVSKMVSACTCGLPVIPDQEHKCAPIHQQPIRNKAKQKRRGDGQ